MTSDWQPYDEPLRVTLLRTVTLAAVAGAIASRWWGGWPRWPILTMLMLWPSFGGHWIELWFLNWLRPRLSSARGVQVAARVGVWFAGGALIALAMRLTAAVITGMRPGALPAWWLGGLAFIAIELIAHLGLVARGRPNFYGGRA
jgi:hypothetical protein